MINKIKEKVAAIDCSFVDKEFGFISKNDDTFKLLIFFASLYKNEILLDLGTNVGQSALALRAQSNDNIIISYDIVKNPIPYENKYGNIIFRLGDVNTEHPSILKNSKFMYLDIDPHDGRQEIMFIQKLKDINYQGMVMCDDIHLNIGMEYFWNNVTEEKIDLSEIGHKHPTGQICGTGLIDFGHNLEKLI